MYQNITIIGNLGRDPELKFAADGNPVTTFSVAVNDGFGENKRVMWVRVSAWGKQAEPCHQYLKKGSKVFVSGHLTADKDTGNPRVYQSNAGGWASSFEMVAGRVLFLDGKADSAPAVDDGDVPF